jgi:hypothetical protein
MGAAKILGITEKEIKARMAAGEFVTRNTTPNVTEIKFHKTDGTPKYIVAVLDAPDPVPPPPPAAASAPSGPVAWRAFRWVA